MPETTYQIPATIEKVEAAGLSAVPGSIGRDADPDAEHGKKHLDDQGDDDAGEDRPPRDPVHDDGVGVLGRGSVCWVTWVRSSGDVCHVL